MTPFEYAQAEHARPSRDWRGWCLVFVRSCFGVGPSAPTALEAWNRAQHKHPETNPQKIPRRVPVFWGDGDGHVALSRGDGSCWTTDAVHPGKVDVDQIAAIGTLWGKPLLGWTEDINGVRVYDADKPAGPIAAATQTPAPAEVRHTYGDNYDAALAALGAAKRANKPGTRRRRLAVKLRHLIFDTLTPKEKK